ncbi:uncharacterized protein LOC125739110 isoform X6 [Brienomyrus brachyistius]|uniref:uncharacterized protein LOC125739110 isoform X6 n=1 Tax=Brienomyrus brachyistius TaxID=42636 RepID=UPI0020B45516|nr:uncharacterized protein LOC125739110 isoform X6 [Brienomyrus brachyistius]
MLGDIQTYAADAEKAREAARRDTDPGREQSPPRDTPPSAVGRKYQNIYQKWRRPPDSHSDTYAALDVKNQSPDYDTLMMLKPAASDRHPAVLESAVYGNMMYSEKGRYQGSIPVV